MTTITTDELNKSYQEKIYTLSNLREAVNNGASPEDIFKACHEYDMAFNSFQATSERFIQQELDEINK